MPLIHQGFPQKICRVFIGTHIVEVHRSVHPLFVVHAWDERVPGGEARRGGQCFVLSGKGGAGWQSGGPGGQGPEVGGYPLGIVGTAGFCSGEQV